MMFKATLAIVLAPLALAFPAPQTFSGSLLGFSTSVGPGFACGGLPGGASGCITPDYACGRSFLGSACITTNNNRPPPQPVYTQPLPNYAPNYGPPPPNYAPNYGPPPPNYYPYRADAEAVEAAEVQEN